MREGKATGKRGRMTEENSYKSSINKEKRRAMNERRAGAG